jgi:hypothetical protein
MRRLLAIVAVLALAALAFLTPTAAAPCRVCKPRICGPCQQYTGDTCYTCGTCEHIPGCHH